MIGYYSEQSAETFGTIIYGHSVDNEFEVTAVFDNETDVRYDWPDAVCLGDVGEYRRTGRRGIEDRLTMYPSFSMGFK